MTNASLQPGAFVTGDGVVYCVWAPTHSLIEVVVAGGARVLPLEPTLHGYFRTIDSRGQAGDLYKFRLDGDDDQLFPDPASRFQPEGVHGPSMVVDHRQFDWCHEDRRPRRALDELVVYELHVGTFTPAGTFAAAIEKLPRIVALGVTALELMPIADFPGRWNWGYDGVMLYAPARAYGTPDDLRALVDAAHGLGLSVILDVVYNHLGPDGNYLGAYAKEYFNPAHKTPWGDALNFDGAHNGPVRTFFLGNIAHWMDDYHVDGFRLDAVHAIMDDSGPHILADIAAAVHERGGFVVAEDERNEASLATPEGTGLDGLWADDFHHVVRVALTGEQESYLQNYDGSAPQLRDTLENGWLYRGQPTPAGGEARGTPCAHLPPHAFVHCISNHDQVGNRAFGERLTASCDPAAYRAASALLCLSPYTPLIFQGQEWGASTPFLYFTDHEEELGRLVTEGRRKEFKDFAAFGGDEASVKLIPDPQAERTFQMSKLDWSETDDPARPAARLLALYREALRLRRDEPALRARGRAHWGVETLTGGWLALTFGAGEGKCEVIFRLQPTPGSHDGPGLDGPARRVIFSSNDPAFGGDGGAGYDPASGRVSFPGAGLLVLKS